MFGDEYQLLDFGSGRKLERFAGYMLDRPSPAAADVLREKRAMWPHADAHYQRDGEQARWSIEREVPVPWLLRAGPLTLELKLTEFGHLGLFPEQVDNWDWIGEQVREAGRPLKVLNLFAYTGASTLAAAAAGAEVVHVDAAANTVAWARRNAAASGLADAPIRWITEDALKFARRELKRGNRYEAVILDPPSYGHGPRGQAWKLDEHLEELLRLCLELTADRRQFLLLTCHTDEWAKPSGLLKYTVSHTPELQSEGRIEAVPMGLVSAAGKRLHCGAALRWSAAVDAKASQAIDQVASELGREV